VLGEKIEPRRGEPVESEPRERIELPAIFEDEISVDEVDLSRLAGYVLYESGPGREDGFLVHEVDEEVFLRMWSGLEEAANTRLGTGLALEVISAWDAPEPVTGAAPSGSSVGASGSDPAISQTGRPSARLQRIPLQGLLAAAVALGEGKAQYISLREPELPVAVLEFLSDCGSVEQEQQELARELDQVHALLKYTNDEIDRQPQWARVYVGERDDFEQALGKLDRVRQARGPAFYSGLRDIYEKLLEDSHLSAHEWERFAISSLLQGPKSLLRL
jgi:hypothetical protein